MRTLHSEWFSDVLALQLDPWGRIFYQGTWCFADDCGRGRAIMRELAGFIFPHDETVAVRPYYEKLVELGKIHHYEVEGQPYYHLVNHYKYQRPNRPTPSKLPRPTIANCPGCHARNAAGDPFVDRFPLMWEAREVGLDPSDRELWRAIVEDHVAQLRAGIAVPTVRLGTKPRQPLLDLLEISESLTEASVSDSTLSTRRNQEVGSRTQDVGSRNNDPAGGPAGDAVGSSGKGAVPSSPPNAADALGDDGCRAAEAGPVFNSLDEVPSHVPFAVARDMLPGPHVDASGMPDGWLEGFSELQKRFLPYYGKGGVCLPSAKVAELKQFLVNLGITARQAVALFDAYEADMKAAKRTPPKAYSINFFTQPFQALLAKQDTTGPVGEAKAAKKGRFAAYTQRSTNEQGDRQHA